MTDPTISSLEMGGKPSVWRFAKASRAHVVVDCADYFALMQEAMIAARQRIMLIGWDFDTRVMLGPGRRWWNLPSLQRPPARLGGFIVWLADRRRSLQIKVLKWKFGAFRFLFRGSMILDLIRWWGHKSVDFRFDAALPMGCSHHQKIAVIDDVLAVCGGIDMTTQRWDTRQHIDKDARRVGPGRKPYDPWHDITLLVEGEIAGVLGELGRERWERACGIAMQPCDEQAERPWPSEITAEFRDVEIGVARTQAAWGGYPEITEIESLFVEHIARAKHFIYAESQYFASRRIAEALALRLREADPPEVVIVNPLTASGWLEQAAMDTARVRLLHALAEHDSCGRLRVFNPFTAGGSPIYVHAKLMIVDDAILRIGSANMNNRSMGLDTETDLFIDADRPANDRAEVRAAIRALRYGLLAEHCDIAPEAVPALLEKHGSMAGLIDALPKLGKRLEPFRLRPLTDTEKAVADNALLDPERPEELFEPISRRRGLFRRGGFLRRPS